MDGLRSFTSLEKPLKLQMIDKSIESDEAALRALKSRRNSMAPISRLPPETLCEIFRCAQLLCVDSAVPNCSPSEWIHLSYVCRHWRNITLNFPRFWVYLPIGNRKWVQEMLKRSKNYSLVIMSKTRSGSKKSGLGLALEHLHRIRELSIRNISAKTWHTLERKLLRNPAPRLERFCLVARDDESDSFFVTKNVLRNADQLRRLELSNCGLNKNSSLLRSLTHLTLHDVLRNSMTIGRFVKILLASMLALEFLVLDDSLPYEYHEEYSWFSDDDDKTPLPSEAVHLARLRTLRIRDSLQPELEILFRSITFPPTTVVSIICHNDDGYQDHDMPDFSGIIPGLARSYSNATPEVKFKTLILCQMIIGPRLFGVHLKLYTEALEDSEMVRHVNTTAHLELVFPSDDRPNTNITIAKVLGDLFASRIPLNDITQIFFAEKIPGLTSETVANIFGKLPAVHSVLAAGNARTVLDAITFRSDTAVSSTNSAHSLSFPCLSSIYLHDMTFMENHLVKDDPAYSDMMLSPEMLRHTLVHRRDHGAAIDKLTLIACSGVCEEDIRLLKEVVVNVE